MKIASVLTPINDLYLSWAAQCGVEGIVIRYPGPDLAELTRQQRWIEAYGMKVAAVEGYLPIELAKMGTDASGAEMREFHQLLRNMSQLGIDCLCYNFMAGTDWVRTQTDILERGGAKVTGFRLQDAQQAVSLNHRPTDSSTTIDAEQLWNNLASFLDLALPEAERCSVTMCMHPDDPPLSMFAGKARIMNCVENFERLMASHASDCNKICFCLGTFAAMGVDIPETIHKLGKHIGYVHFRDVRGTREDFVETFHDNGPTDMAAAMQALHDVGFTGFMRPDHVPQLTSEEDGEPGYTMLGRLFAFGYMRGLMHALWSAKAKP